MTTTYFIKDESVTKEQYLYGIDSEVPVIPQEIIMRRVELLNDQLEELFTQHWMVRDMQRERDLIKAIAFWQNINKEET